MAPYHEDSTSSSEDDAPETVSLAQSKRNIKKGDDALQRVHAAEKVKKKLRNKEKDRRLKAQAENSKRKQRGRNDGDTSLQARMKRAMQEAAEEIDKDGHSGDSDEDGEEFKGRDGNSDEEYGQGNDDINANSEDDEKMDSDEAWSPKTNPNHLPDHLFTSAFASISTKAASKGEAKEPPPAARSKPRKRVRSNAAPKDVLIGLRTIRVLSSSTVAGASTLPTAKVKKFLNRSLGLKGLSSKRRGWERRPVNLGVMRRDGPAASFVRS